MKESLPWMYIAMFKIPSRKCGPDHFESDLSLETGLRSHAFPLWWSQFKFLAHTPEVFLLQNIKGEKEPWGYASHLSPGKVWSTSYSQNSFQDETMCLFILLPMMVSMPILSWMIEFLIFFFHWSIVALGLPRWLMSKESACQCWGRKRRGFDPWVGKISWKRKW